MIKLYFILALILTNFQALGQFNEDSRKIEKLKIKSIKFENHSICTFDQKGRLVEYTQEFTSSYMKVNGKYVFVGELAKYRIDTLGNFTELTGLDYSKCRDSLCTPDTLCFQISKYDGIDLVSTNGWDDPDDYGKNRYVNTYSKSVYGDTIVEKEFSFRQREEVKTKRDDIYVRITVRLEPLKVMYFDTEIPYRYLYSDSARYYLDSANFGDKFVVEYTKNGTVKNSHLINSEGYIYGNCIYKGKGEFYRVTCETYSRLLEKNLSFFNRKFEVFRMEQHNPFTVSPSSFLLNGSEINEVEYYE